jgi:hypothetical protein
MSFSRKKMSRIDEIKARLADEWYGVSSIDDIVWLLVEVEKLNEKCKWQAATDMLLIKEINCVAASQKTSEANSTKI